MYQCSKRLHVIFMTHFYWQLLTYHLRRIQIKWDEEAVEMIKTDKDTKTLEAQAVDEELRLLNIDLEH